MSLTWPSVALIFTGQPQWQKRRKHTSLGGLLLQTLLCCNLSFLFLQVLARRTDLFTFASIVTQCSKSCTHFNIMKPWMRTKIHQVSSPERKMKCYNSCRFFLGTMHGTVCAHRLWTVWACKVCKGIHNGIQARFTNVSAAPSQAGWIRMTDKLVILSSFSRTMSVHHFFLFVIR